MVGKGKGGGEGGGIADISIKTIAIFKRRAFCHYHLSIHSLSVVFPIDATVTLFQYVIAFSQPSSLLRPSPPRSLFSFPSSLHRIFRLSLNLNINLSKRSFLSTVGGELLVRWKRWGWGGEGRGDGEGGTGE